MAGDFMRRPTARSTRLLGGLIVAKICCMAGSAAFASTLVELARLWHLDAAHAGWISSAYFIGYTIAVPVLVGLTDVIDARFIYLAGCAIGALAFAGFARYADGLWSAFVFQMMAGVSLAAVYMPGLRILTQRLTGRARIRAVPYYTSAFGIGTALSYLISGWTAASYGWRASFMAAALASVIAAIVMLLATRGIAVEPGFEVRLSERHPLDFRPALKSRGALAYIFAYGGHCWELFAFRTWLPAFLTFAWTRTRAIGAGLAIARWSMLITLIGVPSSIVGAELAHRWTRDRLLRWFECASVVIAISGAAGGNLSFGFAVAAMFVYNTAITADSGALTAGTVAITRPEEQGATLAVYSLVGFGGGAIGPLAVGSVLDLGGGFNAGRAWYAGFAAMAIGSLLAAISISLLPARLREKSAFSETLAKAGPLQPTTASRNPE
ncbi:MAG: MFS transporter [Candidatus Binataceae bacterium]